MIATGPPSSRQVGHGVVGDAPGHDIDPGRAQQVLGLGLADHPAAVHRASRAPAAPCVARMHRQPTPQPGDRTVGDQLRQRRRHGHVGRLRRLPHRVEDRRPRPRLIARARLVVEHEHPPDARIVRERRDQRLQLVRLVPQQRRVVERVGRGRRGGKDRLQPRDRRGRQRGKVDAKLGRQVGRNRGVAAGTRHDRHAPRHGEHAAADGLAAPAHGLAAPPHRQRLGHLQQVVRVLGPQRAHLLEQRPEHALVAGERARVGLGRGRPGARASRLQHRDADAGGRAALQHRAPLGAVPVGLQVQRDRPHAVALDQRLEEVGGAEHRLIPARHHRVQPQAAPRSQRVHRHVPALRDQRDRPGLARLDRVPPQRDAVGQGHDPVPVRPAHRQPVRRERQRRLQLALARLGEPGGEHDRPAAPHRARPRDHVRRVAGWNRDHDRVRRLGQVLQRRIRAHAMHHRPPRIDRERPPRIPEPREVQQRLTPIRPRPLTRPDHRNRSRRQQGGQSP